MVDNLRDRKEVIQLARRSLENNFGGYSPRHSVNLVGLERGKRMLDYSEGFNRGDMRFFDLEIDGSEGFITYVISQEILGAVPVSGLYDAVIDVARKIGVDSLVIGKKNGLIKTKSGLILGLNWFFEHLGFESDGNGNLAKIL